MLIGALSERTGCHIATIRYDEKEYSAANLQNQNKEMSKVGWNRAFMFRWNNTPPG